MNYLEEDQILFSNILEDNYFKAYKQGNRQIEFYLNGICKSNCQYCYLKKHQKDLFPIELYDKDKIINNTKLLLQWYIKNEFCCNINIFSGEWITTELFQPILDIFYNNFKEISFLKRPKKIICPDNMKFIQDKELTNLVQKYIDLFKEIGIEIIISASIDGKYCDFDRTIYTDDFYIDCFNFLNKNKFLCHPMISSSNVKYWIDNYIWWAKTAPDYITKSLMMLEVRDETWDDESIEDLLKFCDFLIQFKLDKFFNNDLIKFTNYIFQNQLNEIHASYSPELLRVISYFNSSNSIGCTFTDNLFIRVSDLSLGLCHRLFYNNLILGNFKIENNEITNIQMCKNKIPLLIVKTHYKKSCAPVCEKCFIEPLCTGYCCGNSYENYKNILIPTMEVCNLYKAKYTYLLSKYEQMGIFDLIEKDNNNFIQLNKTDKEYLFDIKNKLLKYI